MTIVAAHGGMSCGNPHVSLKYVQDAPRIITRSATIRREMLAAILNFHPDVVYALSLGKLKEMLGLVSQTHLLDVVLDLRTPLSDIAFQYDAV